MLLNSSPCVHLTPDPCPQDSGTPDHLRLPGTASHFSLANLSAGSQMSALQSAASLTLQPAIHCQKIVDIFHSLLYHPTCLIPLLPWISSLSIPWWSLEHGREEAGKQQVEKYLFNLKGNSFLKGLSSHLAYDRGWTNVSFFRTPCFRLSAFSFLIKMTTEDLSPPWMMLFMSVFVYFLMSCTRVKKPLRQVLICLVVHWGCSIWNTVWYWVGVYCLSDRLRE